MNKYIKLLLIFIISSFLIVVFIFFVEKPQKIKTTEVIAARSRYDRGYYGRDRYRRGRGGGGGGFQFRFEIGPSERYYYTRPYYDFVTVNCEILDDENTKVTQVQIGDSVIYLDRANNVRRYYFSLRPGYYTIRWRVSNEKFFGSKYRNYSKDLRVERGRYQIDVTIIGKNIYIR